MVKDFSIISEIKSIREQMSILSERERRLIKPILDDTSLIPAMFKWYCEMKGCCGTPEGREGTSFRQKFVFIILFLYSPIALVNGSIARGIRDVLAETLGFKSPTGISNLCTNMMFNYCNYKNYRTDIDGIYTDILNRLKAKGLIKSEAGS